MATSVSKSSEAAIYCGPCQRIHKRTTIAVYFCPDCCNGLCSECERLHGISLFSINHKVTKLQNIHGKESEFQVSGRRPGRKAARSGSEKGSDQSTDITQRVRGVTLSTGSGKSSTADRAGRVFKTASLKKGVNVSVESDDGLCDIKGIVLLQDRMIVSDYTNSKLKVFDSDYTLQFEHKCDNTPFDIDKVDNTRVVVGILNRTMKVLSVGRDSMEELVNINTEYQCVGVCCQDGKIYCVVCENSYSPFYSEIREYTPDGALKRKFEYLSDGEVDCNHLQYITVNPQTGTLYVTEWNKGVVALTTSGHATTVMSPPQLKNPAGIAVDDHGQIYVCGCGSNNMIQMSVDGSRVVELLSNSPRFKRANCVKIYGNKMFFAHRGSGTVFIYELSLSTSV